MQVFEVFMVLLNRKRCIVIYADYVICNTARKTLMEEKQTYEKTNDGPMKRLMMDPWKDFNSTLFANIVSSLSPAQTLGQAKVFCKI